VRAVAAGASVGYSRSQVFENNSSIATISIGYADGYDRRFSNGLGEMLVNGVLCPVVGSVCMDMTMIDVSGVEVAEGDEVIVYGAGLDIETLAEKIGTISYELLTSVGQRIPRVFYSE
jgi:alanine racemase